MKLFKRDGHYHVEYYDHQLNKLRRKSLKTKNKQEAIQKISELKRLVAEQQKVPNVLLMQFRDDYVTFMQASSSPKYLRSIKLSFRRLIKYVGEDKYLKDLTKPVAVNFLYSVFAESKHAAYLYMRTLKAALNKGISLGYLNENVFVGIKLPKVPKNFPVFISPEELDKIVVGIQEEDIKQIIVFAFFSGMRINEILNLQWSQINFKKHLIMVECSEGFTTKNKSSRQIPIHQKILEILLSRQSKKNISYVFSKNSVRYNDDFISKKFKKGVRAAGLSDDIHFHTLRHSFASNLIQKGISLYVVKELLGHSSISTTQIYSHLKNDNLVNAIAIL